MFITKRYLKIATFFGASVLIFLMGKLAFDWRQEERRRAERLQVVEDLKQTFARQYLDPESIRFRDVQYHADTGVLCGEFNVKNRMGGYVGYRQFIMQGQTINAVRPDIEEYKPNYRLPPNVIETLEELHLKVQKIKQDEWSSRWRKTCQNLD